MTQVLWNETEMVAAAQNGSLDAFNELILHYQTRVYNLARYILKDDAAADDAAQLAFIKAYQALETFRGGSFRSWLLRIVTNLCYDMLRRRKRYPAVSWDDFGELEEEANPHMVDPGMTPEEKVLQHELRALLDKALSILPEEQRLVVVLVDQMGCDYDEAAAITGSPLGTVKSRLYRARDRLREFLIGEGDSLPAKYRLGRAGYEQLAAV